jgi:spore germination cell wall hydrolase CwlJ-like protein
MKAGRSGLQASPARIYAAALGAAAFWAGALGPVHANEQNAAGRVEATAEAAATLANADPQANTPIAADAAAPSVGAGGLRLGLPTPVSSVRAAPAVRAGFQFSNQAQSPEALRCLAEAVYFESRAEPRNGQIAVAEVVMNRVRSPRFPKTVCAVVYQGANQRVCQFSWACDGKADRPHGRAWTNAQDVARMVLAGRAPKLTDGATHFHATRVRPNWSRVYTLTAQIGNHVFYRHVLPGQRGRAIAAAERAQRAG